MTNTNPPVGPRCFISRAMPYPFEFSLIHRAYHDIPENYFDKIPIFNGSLAIPIEQHIEPLWNYMHA